MPAHWIVLNDVRVNVAAQTDGDALVVIHALAELYDSTNARLNDNDGEDE